MFPLIGRKTFRKPITKKLHHHVRVLQGLAASCVFNLTVSRDLISEAQVLRAFNYDGILVASAINTLSRVK